MYAETTRFRDATGSLYTAELLTSGLIEIANELVNSPGMMLINDIRDEDMFAADLDAISLNSKHFADCLRSFVRDTSDRVRKNFSARFQRETEFASCALSRSSAREISLCT